MLADLINGKENVFYIYIYFLPFFYFKEKYPQHSQTLSFGLSNKFQSNNIFQLK